MGPSDTKSNQKSSTTELAFRYGENDVPESRFPKFEQSNHELPVPTVPPTVTGDTPGLSLKNQSTTDSPPVQVMERTGDSTYRIPSSVFTRTKSTTPIEWSVASNESLFSIHMGNMSFSNEIGMPGEAFPSSQCFSFPPNNPPIDEVTNNDKSSEGSGVAEKAAETMKEVTRERSEDQSSKKSPPAPNISHHSDESTASVKSFAFPILTGDIEKGVSVKMGGSVRVAPEQPQPRQQQQQPQLMPQSEPQPLPQTEPQPPLPPPPQTEPQPPPQTEPKTSSATPDKPQTRWFPCFSCCS